LPRRVREHAPVGGRPAASSAEAETPAALPKLLLDTNIVLDVILARAPWDRDAVSLLDSISRSQATGFVAGHAVTTVHYIVERAKRRMAAITAVSDLLQLVQVVALDGSDFQRALSLGLADYEDAVQAAACLRIGASVLVTRNARDFKGAPVVTRSAGEVLALLASSASDPRPSG
jgi:predicted nucleic acid-binding protein